MDDLVILRAVHALRLPTRPDRSPIRFPRLPASSRDCPEQPFPDDPAHLVGVNPGADAADDRLGRPPVSALVTVPFRFEFYKRPLGETPCPPGDLQVIPRAREHGNHSDGENESNQVRLPRASWGSVPDARISSGLGILHFSVGAPWFDRASGEWENSI